MAGGSAKNVLTVAERNHDTSTVVAHGITRKTPSVCLLHGSLHAGVDGGSGQGKPPRIGQKRHFIRSYRRRFPSSPHHLIYSR